MHHPIRGPEGQTSYPKVQWENTLDKRGTAVEREEEGRRKHKE